MSTLDPLRSALSEREAELARLEALVEATQAGHGEALRVSGAAGIGKTQLVRAVAALASERRVRVSLATASPLETGFAWGVARDLLGPLVDDEELYAGAASLARPVLEGAGEGDAAATSLGLYWLLAALAAREPLLLIVDDAHWADEPTLLWLAYCARRLGGVHAGLVVAARGGEGAQAVQDLPALEPAPLTAHGVRACLQERGGEPPSEAVVAACLHVSGGNPFLLTELLDGLGPHPGTSSPAAVAGMRPDRVTESVARRLGALPEVDRSVAQAVAILGDGAPVATVAQLADLSAEDALAAAERLAERSLLDRAAPLRFIHPMIREAVYAGIAPARRAHEHARAARLATGAGAGAGAAVHLLHAEPAGDTDAARVLLEAGRGALAAGDSLAGLRFLERATAEPPPARLRTEVARALGMAKLLSGEPGAIDDLRSALPAGASTRERADVAREVALGLLGQDRLTEGAQLLEDVADSLDLETDRELRLRVEGDLACLAMIRSDMIGMAARRVLPLEPLLRGDTGGERVLLGVIAGLRDAEGAPLAQTWPLARTALAGGQLIDDTLPGSRAWVICANLGIDFDRMDEVAPTLDHALRHARAAGSVGGFAIASAWRAQSALLRGDLLEAEADARAALAASSQPGAALVRPMAAGLLLAVLAERGTREEADALMAELADRADPAHRLWAFVTYYRAHALLATDRADAGVAELVAFGRHIDEASLAGHRWQWRTVATPYLAARGERELAIELAREELAAAADLPASWRGGALRALGVALGDAEILREAVDVLAESPRRLEYARALHELGASQRRAADEKASRATLSQALDVATRGGAVRLAERVRDELRAAGGRPRRAVLTGVEALTPTEARTARMASDGLTNAEIAQALFVTTKTVEAHLTRAYRKLGTTRDGLEAVLA